MIEIRRQGVQSPILSLDGWNVGSKLRRKLMADDYITVPFSLAEAIVFQLGDYIDVEIDGFPGQGDGAFYGRYELVDKYKPEWNEATATFKYELRMEATYMKWKNKICKYLPQTGGGELSFNLTSTITTHLGIIINNLNALGYRYAAPDGRGGTTYANYQYVVDGTVDASAAKLVSYDSISILDALTSIAKAFECEWWVTNSIIHFGKCQSSEVTPVDFILGTNISSMSKSQNGQTYITKMFVFGSDRNLPRNYKDDSNPDLTKSAVVQRRLMLPTSAEITQANAALLTSRGYTLNADGSITVDGETTSELVEGVVVMDDIYPKTELTVRSVETYTDTVEEEDGTTTTYTYYRVRINENFIFNEDMILEGQTLHIIFLSGSLNGMDFECQYVPNDNDPYYEIVANENYGRFLPDPNLHPSVSDKFALYNWDSSTVSGIIPEASNRLLEKAVELLDKSKVDPNEYTCTEDCVESDYELRDLGERIRLFNPSYFPEGRQSRVIGYELNLDMPYDHPTYMIAEKADYVYQSRVNSTESLTFNGQTYERLGIGGGGTVIYLIKLRDTTRPTDDNTFSAKRILNDFLRRNANDTALGKITFKEGLEAGEFTQDTAGAAIYKEGDSWHIEADFIHARRKLIAKELQIEEISHIGGTILLTAAEMVCDHVEEYDGYYRCYFLRKDENGKTIYNKFKRHDQAIMMSFNVEEWEDGTNINRDRYYWRLVEAVSPANIEGDYHYIDLSKTDCDEATYTDAPKAGDKIVQLGYRDSDVENQDRQNAIIIAGAGSGSPYIDEYVGINSYTLEGKCKTRIKPGANFFTGRFDISGDSTFDGQSLMDMFNTDTIAEMMEMLEELSGQVVDLQEGLIDIQDDISEGLSTGNENLLRNTGFTGDYETMDVDGDLGVSEATQVYSDPLEHWERLNARVVANINSTSGFAVVLNNGLISQVATKELVNGDWYNVSFRASGSILTVNIGGYSRTIPLNSSLTRYSFKFVSTGSSMFSITDASATVMEIQLSAGSVPNADWIPSPLDNTSAIAYYQNLVYLTNATVNASTTILGGLILSQMLRVGNYRDGHMSQETGGVSGIYASNASPFIWGGGTMEQAFYTIAKYAQDPSYQATNEEVAQMAKFVVTHGGRAILNDIVLRGYIYALGGYFKGEVHADSGVFKNIVSPNGAFKITEEGNFECENAKIKGSLYAPFYVIDNNNFSEYFNIRQIEEDGSTITVNTLKLNETGLNVRLAWTNATDVNVMLPIYIANENVDFDGATAHILNDLDNNATITLILNHGRQFGRVSLVPKELGIYYCYKFSDDYYKWIVIK